LGGFACAVGEIADWERPAESSFWPIIGALPKLALLGMWIA
jgi:hypothetical protein